jgi:hypothetical protein
MPTYDIINTRTGEVKEIFCSYNDKEQALKQEGNNWQYVLSAPNLNMVTDLDGARAKKAGSEWQSVLNKIDKDAGPKSTVFKNDPYSSGK